ncbi:MAG: hypothetical protein IJL58_07360 [Bacteroidales bacterium]|nr:hypothetical protein [Bacteroidales bacterium]
MISILYLTIYERLSFNQQQSVINLTNLYHINLLRMLS